MNKIDAMLELDRRGKLPEKFRPVLEEYKNSQKKEKIDAYDYTTQKLNEQYRKEGKSVFESPGEFKIRRQKESAEAHKEAALGPVTDATAALKATSSHLYKQAGNVANLMIQLGDATEAGLKGMAPEAYLNAPQEDRTIAENYLKRLKSSKDFLTKVRDKMYSFSEQVAPESEEIRPGVPAAVNRAITQSVPTVAEYASLMAVLGPTQAFSLLGIVDNADKGAKEMAKGGIEGALFGNTITAINSLAMGSRQLTSAALFGGQAAWSGESTEEILAQVITGGALGTLGPKEGPTLRQAFRDRVRESYMVRMQKELEIKLSDDKPVYPNAKIGSITREEAVERLSKGDTEVVPEVLEAAKVLGPEIIKDELHVKARARAKRNGTLEQFTQVENALKVATKMAREKEDVVASTRGADVPEPPSWPPPGSKSTEPITVEPIKISSIIEDMTKSFDKILAVDTRVGKHRLLRKKAAGLYKTYNQMIRLKVANDFQVFSHEIGHHLHKILFGFEWPGKGLKTEHLEPFRSELDAVASVPLKGQDTLPEGFAEFIRMYLTDEVKAKTVAPKFYEFFEKKIAGGYPEIHNILKDARSRWELYQKQPAAAKALSRMSFDKDKSKFGFNQETMQDIYSWYFDDLHSLREFTEMVEKNKKLNYLENPYIMARLFRGWMGKVESFLLKAPLDYQSGGRIPNAKPLSDILNSVKSNLDYFRAYLYALRVFEQSGKVRNINGKAAPMKFGISKAEAKEIIDGADVKMREAANDLKVYHTSLLKYLVDSGILGKENALKILTSLENYVPLYTVADDFHNASVNKGTGKGLTSLFNPIKRQKHVEGRDIVDPLESIIKNTYALVNLAEKQRVLKTFVNLAMKNEGLAKFVDPIPTETKGIPIAKEEFMNMLNKYGKWEETSSFKEFKKEFTDEVSSKAGESIGSAPMTKLEQIVREALMSRGFSKGEAEAYIHKLKESKGAAGREKVINQIVEKHTIVNTVKELNLEDVPDVIWDIFRPVDIKRPNVIKVYENGKKKYYEVNESIYRSLAALDKESVYLVSRILSFPAKMLRLGATTFSPEFALRNPMRDQWMAFIQSKYGYLPAVDFVRGMFHVMKKSDLYWQFKASGGEHSMMTSFDRNYLQSTLKEVINHHELASPVTVPFKTIRHPIEMLTILSEYGEKATRMGEFAKATKKLSKKGNLTPEEIRARAGFASREVTLDFARMGAKGQAINAIVAFWNARLQGFDKIYRQFQEDPVGTTVRTMASITVPQLLLYMAQHNNPIFQEIPSWQKHMFFILVSGAGEDVTKEEWDNMSSEERQVVMDNTTIYRLPMPFELGVLFGGSVVAIGDYITKNDPRAAEEFLHDFIETASPGVPLPTAMVPAMEVWGNWSLFGNRPIVPKYAQEVEPRYQASGYTSELSKKIGETINYSPSKIDHLIRGYTGGFGGLALEAVDKAFELGGVVTPRPEKKFSESMPGLKGFIVRFPNANTKSLRRFYVEYEKISQQTKTLTFLQKAGEIDKAEKYFEEHEEAIANSAAMDKVHNAFSKYHIMVREIFKDEDFTPEEKRKAIDEIYLEMTELAERAMRNYDER